MREYSSVDTTIVGLSVGNLGASVGILQDIVGIQGFLLGKLWLSPLGRGTVDGEVKCKSNGDCGSFLRSLVLGCGGIWENGQGTRRDGKICQ